MSARVWQFPKVRTLFAGIAAIWLAVIAWLILRPPPDPFVGQWLCRGDRQARLTVGRDAYWITVSGQGVTVSGRWSRIEMPVYQWKQGFHSNQSGRVASGYRTSYYAQADLDREPTLRQRAQVTPIEKGRVYQMENRPERMVLIERRPGELELYWGGQSFGYREVPRPWWETAWNRIQTWGRT